MDNGKFTHKRRHKGGILLTALLFVQLLSLMLLLVLENSRTTALFYTKTIETYEARIMSELFHAEFLQNELADQGSRLYNVGKMTYARQGQLLQIECHVKSRRFTFTFLLPEEEPEIDTDDQEE